MARRYEYTGHDQEQGRDASIVTRRNPYSVGFGGLSSGLPK